MKWLWICLAALACDSLDSVPTWDGYDAQLTALHGQSINAVVLDWGPPAERIELAKGDQAYVWTQKTAMKTPDRFQMRQGETPDGQPVVNGEIHRGEEVGVSCKTTLLVNVEGNVTGHKAEGAGCIGFAPIAGAVASPAPVGAPSSGAPVTAPPPTPPAAATEPPPPVTDAPPAENADSTKAPAAAPTLDAKATEPESPVRLRRRRKARKSR